MAEKRNLCAMIPLDLFTRVGAERDKAGQTNSEFITNLLTEYFMMKENGGANMTNGNGKERTLAFQISEDLFQRIKAHLERESRRLGSKVTQKDFVIGLIEAALAEAEQEAEGTSNGTGEAEQESGTVNGGTDEASPEAEQPQEIREEQQDGDREPNAAPEENAQEAPCEDGVPSEDGVASQPTENG